MRGLSPYPGAWTTLVRADGKETVLKLYKVKKSGIVRDGAAGSIVVENKKLYIVAGDGELVEVLELQLSGKKIMSATDFLNGNQALIACR